MAVAMTEAQLQWQQVFRRLLTCSRVLSMPAHPLQPLLALLAWDARMKRRGLRTHLDVVSWQIENGGTEIYGAWARANPDCLRRSDVSPTPWHILLVLCMQAVQKARARWPFLTCGPTFADCAVDPAVRQDSSAYYGRRIGMPGPLHDYTRAQGAVGSNLPSVVGGGDLRPFLPEPRLRSSRERQGSAVVSHGRMALHLPHHAWDGF